MKDIQTNLEIYTMGLLDKMKVAANSISEAAKKTGNEVAQASKRVNDKFSDFKVEDITNHLQTYEKYFSESELWNKLTTYGKTIGATVLYPVLLLFNLFKSPEIELAEKAIIIGTLGYFILPLDLIPDSKPGAGYTDDATALMAAIKYLSANITPAVRKTAKEQLKTLLGQFDEHGLEGINTAIDTADKFSGK